MEEQAKKPEDRILEIETLMQSSEFWADKNKAQSMVKELNDLKEEIANGGKMGKYDKGNAIMTIFSGAGGDDAEDFSAILYRMYRKLSEKKGWGMEVLHEHENDHGGYRNITVEIKGAGDYGILKNESGVHRLVRISPFNAKQLRHTSFSMVEIIPKFEKAKEVEIPEEEREVSFDHS